MSEEIIPISIPPVDTTTLIPPKKKRLKTAGSWKPGQVTNPKGNPALGIQEKIRFALLAEARKPENIQKAVKRFMEGIDSKSSSQDFQTYLNTAIGKATENINVVATTLSPEERALRIKSIFGLE